MSTATNASVDYGLLKAVWGKAKVLPGFDPCTTRQDIAGARIDFNAYGSDGQFGWEIDHLRPVAKGGGDWLSNLQPLQWQNNRSKGDSYPTWESVVAYELGYNVHRRKRFIVQ